MGATPACVRARQLLPTPRHDVLGRLLGGLESLPAIGKPATRLQRVRRKRFLTALKTTETARHISAILHHDAGRKLQTALTDWLASSAPAACPPPPEPTVHGSTGPHAVRCSLIINTDNRAAELTRTLADLKPLWKRDHDELIIVLGPTPDGSAEAVRAAGLPCRVLACPERNIALSRNLGLAAAQGRHVAFLDDDASPEPGWLDAITAALDADPSHAVAAGFALDGRGGRFLTRYVVADFLGRSRWFDDAAAAAAEIDRLGADRAFLTATGCNMGFRRSRLGAIGSFDPFYRYFLEETDAVLRLILGGGRCVACPESVVRHRLGPNHARQPDVALDQRLTMIRSQLHFIGKFGKQRFTPPEIETCIWQRVLADLERIAWNHPPGRGVPTRAGATQEAYLRRLAQELESETGATPL